MALVITEPKLAKAIGGGARQGEVVADALGRRYPCFDGDGDRPCLDEAIREVLVYWLARMDRAWPSEVMTSAHDQLLKSHSRAKQSRTADARAAAQGVHLGPKTPPKSKRAPPPAPNEYPPAPEGGFQELFDYGAAQRAKDEARSARLQTQRPMRDLTAARLALVEKPKSAGGVS